MLLGFEVIDSETRRGPFAALGLGVGRSKLSGARGVFEPPYGSRWIIPDRDLNAFAFRGGLGYRFTRGPGPLGFQLGVRGHALADHGSVPASAFAITLGLAY